MEKKISKPKKKGWGEEFVQIIGFQVTSSASIREDSMCPLQKLFLWSFVMTLKPLYATRKPKKKKSHCLDKINYTVCTARQDDTERRRQLSALWDSSPTFFPPIQVFSKSDCGMLTASQNRRLSPLGFQFCHSFPSSSIEKCHNLGNWDKNTKWNTRLGMILFVCAGISMNSISGLSDSMAPKLWLSVALLLCGI